MLRILVVYRLLSPGSEWRLDPHWFGTTALADLLGVDERAVQDDTLYRSHDLVLPLKEELFAHLRQRWSDLFGARYEVLLYDLTSTYWPRSNWTTSRTTRKIDANATRRWPARVCRFYIFPPSRLTCRQGSGIKSLER